MEGTVHREGDCLCPTPEAVRLFLAKEDKRRGLIREEPQTGSRLMWGPPAPRGVATPVSPECTTQP